MKNIKNAPRSGVKNELNLNQTNHENRVIKSYLPDLNDLEINLCVNICIIFLDKQNFTMTNLEMAGCTGTTELEVENAINHLIEHRYLKIVLRPRNLSNLRYLEPYEVLKEFMIKMVFHDSDN